MKRTWKQIGSLFMAVCMVLTMLPMTSFAETGDSDSGAPLGTSGIITAFAELDTKISKQTVETGTRSDELNLPGTLAVTVTESVYGIATGSDAEKQETQTTVDVSGWIADPAYDGDADGEYIFTPALDLPDGLTVAEGVSAPQITVTVETASLARGGVALMSGTVTGTMDIGGETSVSLADTVDNLSSSGWAWDAATATLTLNSGYSGTNGINIQCDASDTIYLVLEDDVTIRYDSLFVLTCAGNLNIKAGSYTLDLSSNVWPAIATKDLVIESGMVIAIGGDEMNGIQAFGDVTINGNANVTATSPGGSDGWGGSGIMSTGDVHITTSGEVHTSGYKNGIYADGGITISSGTVTANGVEPAALIGKGSGVTVTGGTVTTNTTGSANGDVKCDLTVNGASANVAINGSITNNGSLTVSGGNVTVTGTVAGSQNLTGGTVEVNGVQVYPAGGVPRDITADFTDVNFKAAVYAKIGKTAPAPILDTDVAGIISLVVRNKSIASLAGIEHFTSLEELDCSYNKLTVLPALPSGLWQLLCVDNRLTALPALPTNLMDIDCSGNQLTSLPSLPSTLTRLYCYNNQLTTLDVSALSAQYIYLDCHQNRLTGLVLNGSAGYALIDVSYNYLASQSAVTGQAITWDDSWLYQFSPQHADGFKAVTSIIDLPSAATVGVPLTLSGTVIPSDATNQTIIWEINNKGTTGATISNGIFTATSAGTAEIFAYITNGAAADKDRWEIFYIAVTGSGNGGSGGGNGGGGGGGGGGSSSGGGTTVPPTSNVVTDKQPNMPTTAKMSVNSTEKDGILSATITEQIVKDAIKAAQDAAKKSGRETDGIALDFNITGSGSYVSLNASIDAGAVDRLKEAGVKFVKIGSSVLDITLDAGAIAELDNQSTGMVTVTATRLTKLSQAAKKLIGNRPVFDITVSYQKNGKTEYVTNFGKGAVTLGIAYKAADKEKSGNLFGVYVDKNGKPQLLANSSYDNGRIIFSRNSLSTYGVGYKVPSPAFTDTAKHWAKDNIDFVASRDLIRETTASTFAPNTAITRADFLMALGRLSGADVSIYKTSSFTDVKVTDTAMPYIEWAVGSKIVSGYGNRIFGPNDLITREQMAVMMQNYAKATGYKLPVSVAAVTFSDSAKFSAYAKDAVKAIQQAGIMQGNGSSTFDPQGNATRAEASTILRRFVELVIDKGTARGWSQNDSGQWQYIDVNGKAATGWLTAENGKYHYYLDKDGIMVSGKWLQIDGKWYYFYADGALAKSTKVDGYEVDESGVRKSK